VARSDDIDRLLGEVERSLGRAEPAGSPRRTPAKRRERAEPAEPRLNSVEVATIAAVVAAAAVFAVFTLTPFLGAVSGAAGAFLGVFLTVLVGRLRRR
jgi:hypothetical protein